MSIVYKCRHCRHVIGQLDQRYLTKLQASFNEMSSSEQAEIVHYDEDGDMNLLIICENCEKSLKTHPHYHELDFFIQ